MPRFASHAWVFPKLWITGLGTRRGAPSINGSPNRAALLRWCRTSEEVLTPRASPNFVQEAAESRRDGLPAPCQLAFSSLLSSLLRGQGSLGTAGERIEGSGPLGWGIWMQEIRSLYSIALSFPEFQSWNHIQYVAFPDWFFHLAIGIYISSMSLWLESSFLFRAE